MPLSAYGKDYTPPAGKVDPGIDMKTAVRDQVNRMDAVEYFTLLAQLMKRNPAYAADAPALKQYERIGLVAGKDYDPSKLKADFVKRIPQAAFDRIMLQFKVGKTVKNINGWMFDTQTGIYGTDYLNRAFVTAIGLGANRPEDAVYPTSLKDAKGDDYSGKYKYVMRFPKGQLPPAQGFWSLTMYNAQYFFVANPINRYSISARQNLKTNADGSVDLYIQHESPGKDKESNWLPAPSGQVHPHDALVLAEREDAVDPQRHVVAAGGEARGLRPPFRRAEACAPARPVLHRYFPARGLEKLRGDHSAYVVHAWNVLRGRRAPRGDPRARPSGPAPSLHRSPHRPQGDIDER